jgi:hypothetical protein
MKKLVPIDLQYRKQVSEAIAAAEAEKLADAKAQKAELERLRKENAELKEADRFWHSVNSGYRTRTDAEIARLKRRIIFLEKELEGCETR